MSSTQNIGAANAKTGFAKDLIVVFTILALAVPTLLHLSAETWSTDSGAQGPIILFTSGWLIWQAFKPIPRPHRSDFKALFLLIPVLVLYIFGRAYDFLFLEVGGLYGVVVSYFAYRYGWRSVFNNWFPFFYVAFIIPPPAWLITQITEPLKHLVSFAAISALHPLGIPVSSEGVTIFVAQYQLLVEDACSGMNSLIGLTAIGLFYIYLRRGASVIYSMFLVTILIPIAILANIIRIIILILLTYFFGDAVGQGFLHFLAGISLFVISLSLVFALDTVLHSVFVRAGALKHDH